MIVCMDIVSLVKVTLLTCTAQEVNLQQSINIQNTKLLNLKNENAH